MRHRPSRRDFLVQSAGAIAGLGLAACGDDVTPSAGVGLGIGVIGVGLQLQRAVSRRAVLARSVVR